MSEICGEIFLVGARPNSMSDNPNIEHYYTNHHDITIRGDLVNAADDGLFAQVWCCNNDSTDWQSHGVSTELGTINDFPEWIPISSIEGLKETDSFEIEHHGITFKLTCRQLKHKYGVYGPFHRALARIKASYEYR